MMMLEEMKKEEAIRPGLAPVFGAIRMPYLFETETLPNKRDSKVARWYQEDAVKETIKHLEDGYKRIVICAPTGTGKTLISRLFVDEYRRLLKLDRPIRVLFSAHLKVLLDQAEKEYKGDQDVELIPQSAYSEIPEEVVRKGWDVTIMDECHHEAMSSYQQKLEMMGDAPIIGLSATPFRDDGKAIKFSKIVMPISREQAVREGYISSSHVHSIIDEEGENKTKGITWLVRRYGSKMGRTLIFVKTRQEVADIAENIAKMGYSVRALLGTKTAMTKDLDDFNKGKVRFIVNCQKIDEGVDLKNCTDVILGRSYGSKRMLNQVIGRTVRPDSPSVIWEFVDPLTEKYTAPCIVSPDPDSMDVIYYDHDDHKWKETRSIF